MKNIRFALLMCTALTVTDGAFAQLPDGHALLPANPSSLDELVLVVPTFQCMVSGDYRVEFSSGRIRVTLADKMPTMPSACYPMPPIRAEIGRLPAGDYLLDVVRPSTDSGMESVVKDHAFKITDGRDQKASPYVYRDVSGHWWNPARNGEGFMIWHDARDQFLAAWFTYDANGQPKWYSIQGGRWTDALRYEGKIYESSRTPLSLPVVPKVSASAVGTAEFKFIQGDDTNGATLTYTIGDKTEAISLKRFSL